MKGIAKVDYMLITGGPVGTRKVLATFLVGEPLTILRANQLGEYPALYSIAEYPEAGRISKKVIRNFVRFV